MCLNINSTATKEFIEKNKNKKFVWLYKLFRGNNGSRLLSFVRGAKSNAGWIVSDRPKREIRQQEMFYGCVDNGIHAYTKYPKWQSERYIARVKAKMSDLIACGNSDDIVFMKVWLPLSEKKKVMKKIKDFYAKR